MVDKKRDSAPSLSEMRALMRLVLWAALIAVGGWISLPLPGVPISLQTFFVVLVGLTEGPKRGALACGLYLLAGLLGLPVFTGGVGGPAILFKPSAGFAFGFPMGAAVAGWLAHRSGRHPAFRRLLLAGFVSGLPIYALGYLGLQLNTEMDPRAIGLLMLQFLPGDILKYIVAASLVSTRGFRRRFGPNT